MFVSSRSTLLRISLMAFATCVSNANRMAVAYIFCSVLLGHRHTTPSNSGIRCLRVVQLPRPQAKSCNAELSARQCDGLTDWFDRINDRNLLGSAEVTWD